MIEIQCSSCNTRYRIDERVLPDEQPTFKCSRCGHVFTADPLPAQRRREPAPKMPVERTTEPKPSPPPQPPPVDQHTAPEPEPEREEPHSFAETESPEDNLSFDFSSERGPNAEPDESSTSEETVDVPDDSGWKVGDTEPDEEAATGNRPSRTDFSSAAPDDSWTAAVSRPAAPQYARSVESRSDRARTHADEELPVIAPLHGSGWFLAVFFGIAVAAGIVSLLLCISPAASARLLSVTPGLSSRFERPIKAAKLVALHNVQASYRALKSGQRVLVISGTAENLGPAPLHQVLIASDLLDSAQRTIGSEASWCGNGLSEHALEVMTPHEIEFLSKLDPQKGFQIAAGGSTAFALAFVNPPQGVANFRISVARAESSVTSENGGSRS